MHLRMLSIVAAMAALLPVRAMAHCQVPCGIYDDAARIAALREDQATIARAVKLLGELAPKADAQSRQQFVRWVMTKEQHAERVIRTVSDYFLAQKLKPVAAGHKLHPGYLQQLADHHAVIVTAMGCKQSAAAPAVKALGLALDRLARHYRR